MADACSIYVLRDPRSRKIRYVGLTCNPTKRIAQHIGARLRNGTPKNKWLCDLADNKLLPIMQIVHQLDSYGAAHDYEFELTLLLHRNLPRGQILNRQSTRKSDLGQCRRAAALRSKRAKWALAYVESQPDLAAMLDLAIGPDRKINRHDSEEWSRAINPEAATEYAFM